jgi:hypothetical protein
MITNETTKKEITLARCKTSANMEVQLCYYFECVVFTIETGMKIAFEALNAGALYSLFDF